MGDNLKENSKRAKLAINILWLICAIDIIAVISGYWELDLLSRIENEEMVPETSIDLNDLRQQIIGIVQFGLYITSAVIFLNWFRRAYGNLQRVGISDLKYTEKQVVWSFFIPLVNLVRPFKIAKEISNNYQKKSNELTGYQNETNMTTVRVWWTLFLISGFLAQIAMKSKLKAETIVQFSTSTELYIISDFIEIPSAIITILMIHKISKKENYLMEKMTSGQFASTNKNPTSST